jgi:hypothetical protein
MRLTPFFAAAKRLPLSVWLQEKTRGFVRIKTKRPQVLCCGLLKKIGD